MGERGELNAYSKPRGIQGYDPQVRDLPFPAVSISRARPASLSRSTMKTGSGWQQRRRSSLANKPSSKCERSSTTRLKAQEQNRGLAVRKRGRAGWDSDAASVAFSLLGWLAAADTRPGIVILLFLFRYFFERGIVLPIDSFSVLLHPRINLLFSRHIQPRLNLRALLRCGASCAIA